MVAAQKMKFSVTDFYSKCEQIFSFPRIFFFTLTKEIVNKKLQFLYSYAFLHRTKKLQFSSNSFMTEVLIIQKPVLRFA